MVLKDHQDKTVLQKDKMLGEEGHVILEDDIAASPYGKFFSTIEMDPGIYSMTLTIHDKIAEDKVSVSKPFTLK